MPVGFGWAEIYLCRNVHLPIYITGDEAQEECHGLVLGRKKMGTSVKTQFSSQRAISIPLTGCCCCDCRWAAAAGPSESVSVSGQNVMNSATSGQFIRLFANDSRLTAEYIPHLILVHWIPQQSHSVWLCSANGPSKMYLWHPRPLQRTGKMRIRSIDNKEVNEKCLDLRLNLSFSSAAIPL